MADILSFVRAGLATKNFPQAPPPGALMYVTAAELELVYKVFDTAKSLDDLPLFTRDVK